MSDYIKLCPFCKGEGRVGFKQFDIFNAAAYVKCKRCGARTDLVVASAKYSAKDRAIRLWNMRA